MNLESEFDVIAKTSFGLEDVLAEELQRLGATGIEKMTRAVKFRSDKELLYKANVWVRTASRIIVPYKKFRIKDADDLYQRAKSVRWEEIFDEEQTFSIDSTVISEMFNHTKYPALKMKDAICDRFRDLVGKRPDVDTDNPDIRINLHIGHDNVCAISIDSSGDPLFKRGYRESRSEAPMKEDLAAGLILLSGWERDCTFVDLFSGSGTLLIEAATYAHNIAPNLKREAFGFMHWRSYDDTLFEKVLSDAEAQKQPFTHKIIGTEIDGRVIGMCQANIRAAGVFEYIELIESDFQDFTPPEGPGVIVSNPPYGERIGENVDDLYTAFGDKLKSSFTNWNAWFLSSNMDALKKVGLRPSRKIKLYNGSLECRMMKYEMYRGTKKIHKLEGYSEGEVPQEQKTESRAVPKRTPEEPKRHSPRRSREERGFQRRSFDSSKEEPREYVKPTKDQSAERPSRSDEPRENSTPSRGFQRKQSSSPSTAIKSSGKEQESLKKEVVPTEKSQPERRSFSRNVSSIPKKDAENTENQSAESKAESTPSKRAPRDPKGPRKIRKFGK